MDIFKPTLLMKAPMFNFMFIILLVPGPRIVHLSIPTNLKFWCESLGISSDVPGSALLLAAVPTCKQCLTMFGMESTIWIYLEKASTMLATGRKCLNSNFTTKLITFISKTHGIQIVSCRSWQCPTVFSACLLPTGSWFGKLKFYILK